MGANDINQMGKFYTTNMIYDSMAWALGGPAFHFVATIEFRRLMLAAPPNREQS